VLEEEDFAAAVLVSVTDLCVGRIYCIVSADTVAYECVCTHNGLDYGSALDRPTRCYFLLMLLPLSSDKGMMPQVDVTTTLTLWACIVLCQTRTQLTHIRTSTASLLLAAGRATHHASG
jgi:hypothetical protein